MNQEDPLQLAETAKVIREKVDALLSEIKNLEWYIKQLSEMRTGNANGNKGVVLARLPNGTDIFLTPQYLHDKYRRYSDKITDTMAEMLAEMIADCHSKIEEKKAAL